MALKPESIEFRDKVMAGVHKAVRELVISSAARNESLVIADDNGNVLHVPAKDLLHTVADPSALVETATK